MSRALVLSGGGSFVVFQVGVLAELAKLCAENSASDRIIHPAGTRVWYRDYAGVSGGAVNAAYLAQYGLSGVDGLVRLWTLLDDRMVKRHWLPFSYLHVLWEAGLYNTAPLRELIRHHFDPQRVIDRGNRLRVVTVNARTHAKCAFGENRTEIVEAVMASAAFPFVFEAVKIGDDQHTDGGAREMTPLEDALCMHGVTGADVILASRFPGARGGKKKKRNGLWIGRKALESALDEIAVNDIRVAMGRHPDKDVRVCMPPFALEGDALTFDHGPIMRNMEVGRRSAGTWVDARSL